MKDIDKELIRLIIISNVVDNFKEINLLIDKRFNLIWGEKKYSKNKQA